MSPRAFAVIRAVPESFVQAISAVPPDPPIDVARARAQHQAYAGALASLGLEVVRLEADESCPDCCFVEDTAVIAEGVAVVTRPGAPSRRPEVDPVAAALSRRLEVLRMPAPATLDGGDCLRLGRTFYVGLSARSNEAGVAYLRDVLGPRGWSVVAVEMPPGVLHLKTVCSPLDDSTVLVAEATLPAGTFGAARVLAVPRSEAPAANAVAVGRSVLVASGFPRTAALLEASGFSATPVDTSELRKADGALTCLSLLGTVFTN